MRTIMLRLRRRPGTVAAATVGSAVLLAAVIGAFPGADAAEGPPCSDYGETERALRAYVADAGTVGAAVEVWDPECGSWTVSVGVADLETERPVEAGDRFRIGSTTKTFTAVVALQLADEGRLDLDATVEEYLPGRVSRNGYDGGDMTVEDLLRHTAGLPGHEDAFDFEDLDAWRLRTFTDGELLDLALALPAPQEEWSYSNTGAVVAGMIVESVTGRSIGAEITDRVIAPLELKDTYWPGRRTSISGPHLNGHWPSADAPGTRVDITEFTPTFAGAAGALVSNLADQRRFFTALLDGDLVSDESLDRMRETTDASEDGLWPGAAYGLGLIATELERCEGTYWGHGGTFPGYATRGGTTRDGRSVQLVLNDTPQTDDERTGLIDLVDTAMCENREH